MKRAAIISMAAFYLLLTTGMFVCIVHCGAQSIISKPMAMAHAGMGIHGAKKHCNGNEDCGCCKKHGNYVVKENIKPSFELQFAQAGIRVEQSVPIYSHSNLSAISNTSWIEGKAPPWKTGKLISIQNHSLQI
ncbi:hypothetical protein [Mucilaginibacter flavus]|uniref:hypothetical protein n=1 Tax=Mucilaginibacter flavus TaxID=931504 RepID=UPI0025B29188|nr:hypothetical protein [Mucilaginibacter flavus]MDN3581623.1 hypothetical protein [Mucilaginibacter flavus]